VIIASSTSGLLPSRLQSGMAHPERFVVGHPFNPVYLIAARRDLRRREDQRGDQGAGGGFLTARSA